MTFDSLHIEALQEINEALFKKLETARKALKKTRDEINYPHRMDLFRMIKRIDKALHDTDPEGE